MTKMEDEMEEREEDERAPWKRGGAAGRREIAQKTGTFVSGAIGKARQVVGAGADWAQENPLTGLVFLGLLYVVYKLAKGKRCATMRTSGHFQTSGVFSDLARITGAQSNPPWVPSGADLEVRTLQHYLNAVSNAGLREDGKFGVRTSAALQAFQQANGLPATGAIDEETAGALEYFFFATSKNPRLKSAAILSPESASQLGVTYSPYEMPAPVRYSSYAMPGSYYPRAFQPSQRYRAGIQSISMSDYRHHFDVPGHFEDWGPGPGGSWG